jgi:FG-GAP repeat
MKSLNIVGGIALILREIVGSVVHGQCFELRPKQTIIAPDGALLDKFGSSCALGEDLLVVGAPGSDAAALDGGATYVFRRVAGA